MKLCNFGSFKHFPPVFSFFTAEVNLKNGWVAYQGTFYYAYLNALLFLLIFLVYFLLSQNKAIWSVSVPCIVFSALVVFSYYHFGLATLVRSRSFPSQTDAGFLHEDTSLTKYTEKEEEALAVFGIIVILSILEMIVAAAIAKISDTSYQSPQSSPMYYMYSQVSIRRNYSANPITCSCG